MGDKKRKKLNSQGRRKNKGMLFSVLDYARFVICALCMMFCCKITTICRQNPRHWSVSKGSLCQKEGSATTTLNP
jgi:hypothetical protein